MRRRCFLRLPWLLLGATGGARAEPFARGLLWQISRPGTTPSYLFGTMHTADPRLLDLPPAVEAAFAGARNFVLELYPDEAVARRFAEASELPAGQRLAALLPAAAYPRLAAALAGRGVAPARVDRLKPWAALLLLTETAPEPGPGPGSGSTPSLDLDFYLRARRSGKTIDELDSVEEQIAVFDGLPLATQIELLSVALERLPRLSADHEQSLAAYRRGDLRRLTELAGSWPGASPLTRSHLAQLEKKIIHDRSVVMAYRLQTFLRRGQTFAAVGALHLYGRRGILQLLRDEGWTVRRRD